MTKRVRVLKEMPFAKVGYEVEPDERGDYWFPQFYIDSDGVKALIKEGWLEWVEEPKELCMCNHSTVPGSSIGVDSFNPLICSSCHKELPFSIFKTKVEKEKSLEEKLADYTFNKTELRGLGEIFNPLAQIAHKHEKELHLKAFDEAVKRLNLKVKDSHELLNHMIIRKALEDC